MASLESTMVVKAPSITRGEQESWKAELVGVVWHHWGCNGGWSWDGHINAINKHWERQLWLDGMA